MVAAAIPLIEASAPWYKLLVHASPRLEPLVRQEWGTPATETLPATKTLPARSAVIFEALPFTMSSTGSRSHGGRDWAKVAETPQSASPMESSARGMRHVTGVEERGEYWPSGSENWQPGDAGLVPIIVFGFMASELL